MGRSGRQWADVAAEQPDFAVLDDHVGFLELHAAGADRFHFPAFEHEAGLEAFLVDEIVVKSLLVGGDAHGRRGCAR